MSEKERVQEVAKDPWMVKILKYMLDQGVVHTAQVARGVHIATTTAHKYLERLVDDGLVVANRVGVGKPVYWTVKKVDKVGRIVVSGTVKTGIKTGKITLKTGKFAIDTGKWTYGAGKKTIHTGKKTLIKSGEVIRGKGKRQEADKAAEKKIGKKAEKKAVKKGGKK